ncbi:PIG-L family deacetylase [Yinghuangia soli]|uniref:PIG-L family deacetylase n=1 Tax=Yinghuangia soli TaxID=2908204 RepID=A0AA41PWE6_9ACTN|nr:PIG-L family deacetylase [Yinghuangia soli]MCF2527080.1 PIG-L family deacetylase [Yinghuangia soli]
MRRRRISAVFMAVFALAAGLVSPSAGQAGVGRPAVMQIVAHQDDDLLFMNPDIQKAIDAGVPLTTVYLTAGENTPKALPAGVSQEEYAEHRQEGVREAYAWMAGVDGCEEAASGWGACWDEVRPSGLPRPVEAFKLKSPGKSVTLVFLNLPEAADKRHLGGKALEQLGNSAVSTSTLDADGPNGAVWPVSYTGLTLRNVLTALITWTEARVVRALDTTDDPSHAASHSDHVAAGKAADAAVAHHQRMHPDPGVRVLMEHYRDYNISALPQNLSGPDAAQKTAAFAKYAANDGVLLKSHAVTADGMPDPATGSGAGYGSWAVREYAAESRGTQWAGRDAAGRIHAFVAVGATLYEWTENAAGGFDGPVVHAGPPVLGAMAEGVAVGNDQGGRMAVFVQARLTRNIWTHYQRADGSWGWADLGNPNAGRPERLYVSPPTVVSNADGRLQVFVRNGGGGISTRWQTTAGGAWSDWTHFTVNVVDGKQHPATEPVRGTVHLVQGAPTAVLAGDARSPATRRIELFGSAPSRVIHAYQTAHDSGFTSDPGFPVRPPASPVRAAVNASGRVDLMFRAPGTGQVQAFSQTAPDAGFAPVPADVGSGGQNGVGEIAAGHGDDGNGIRIVAAQRTGAGSIGAVLQNSPDGPFGTWKDIGGGRHFVGLPVVAVDRLGSTETPVVLALGADGRLWVSRGWDLPPLSPIGGPA